MNLLRTFVTTTTAAAALLAACLWANHCVAVPLKVDFRSASNNGGGPGALQPGFVDFAHDGTAALTLMFANNELAGTGNSVGVTARADFWRSRPPITSGPFLDLSPLLSDAMLDNKANTMSLSFSNLLDGEYNLKLYHHEPTFGTENVLMDILVNNGVASFTAATGVPTTGGTAPTAISTSEFTFFAVSGSPVEITFDFTAATFGNEVVAVSGFELQFIPPPPIIPEPSTLALLAMAIPALAASSRRLRNRARRTG